MIDVKQGETNPRKKTLSGVPLVHPPFLSSRHPPPSSSPPLRSVITALHRLASKNSADSGMQRRPTVASGGALQAEGATANSTELGLFVVFLGFQLAMASNLIAMASNISNLIAEIHGRTADSTELSERDQSGSKRPRSLGPFFEMDTKPQVIATWIVIATIFGWTDRSARSCDRSRADD